MPDEGDIWERFEQMTPYERALMEFRARARNYEIEMELLSEKEKQDEPWRKVMRKAGRLQ